VHDESDQPTGPVLKPADKDGYIYKSQSLDTLIQQNSHGAIDTATWDPIRSDYVHSNPTFR
jgi:hypothetical protein